MTHTLRDRIRSAFSLLTGVLRRDEMAQRLSDEARFHLDMAAEANVHAGMNADEANRAALLDFGARQRWREEARDEYRSRHLEELAHDIRYAFRSLNSARAFTFAAIATLALSIGATTSMFSVVNAVLLRGLPYRGAALALTGIVIGTVGGLFATRLMAKLLFGVAPGDIATFAGTAAVLAAVALVATVVPGRRATRVDPIAVLRGE
jgi:hypothetical protein